MIVDRTRALEVLIGLPDIVFLRLEVEGMVVRVVVEQRVDRPSCPSCGRPAVVKDRDEVEHVDLPAFGRQTRLVWVKHRWECSAANCPMRSWTGQDDRIAPARGVMTHRCARWCTEQVGRSGRAISDVARELGCDWHTVNQAVVDYGEALLAADHERIATTAALGLDDTLFARVGRFRQQCWSTSIVDVQHGVLLDMIEGRRADDACYWLALCRPAWRDRIRYGTLDMSGAYRSVFDTMLPDAIQVVDPFHLIKLANERLDECRRRVQNDTLGHRGRKDDPLYRARRLLTKGDERLDDKGRSKLLGLLDRGDPHSEVRDMWHAKEVVRSIYDIDDPGEADQFVSELAADLQHPSRPVEARSLGRTLARWHAQIVAWHHARVTNAATEAANNLIKRIKRVAFGFRVFRHYRIRALLYAGRPNWALLATVTP